VRLAREILDRSQPGKPDRDRDETFEDRAVRLETTFDGAGVLAGDLTRTLLSRKMFSTIVRCRSRLPPRILLTR
jgi:hypothetical protein